MKIIFIASTGRSGSTLMDVMLGNNPSGLSLGEVYALFRPFRKGHYNNNCRCGDIDCVYNKIIINSGEEDFHENLLNIPELNYLVDSSKDINYLIDCYNRNMKKKIDQHFLLVYKTPISLAYSHYKRGKSINAWMRFYFYYNEFIETGIPFYSVNYEDLVKNPTGTLKAICTKFEIPYHSSLYQFWNNPVHHFFGSKSVQKIYDSQNPNIFSSALPENFTEIFESCKSSSKYGTIENTFKLLQSKDIKKQNIIVHRNEIQHIPVNLNYRKREVIHTLKKIRNKFFQNYPTHIY